jgi:hypothetical protein
MSPHNPPTMQITAYVQAAPQLRTTLNAEGQDVPTVCIELLGEGPAQPKLRLQQQFADHATAQACARRYTKGAHVLVHLPVFGLTITAKNVPHLERLPDLPPVANAPDFTDSEKQDLFA